LIWGVAHGQSPVDLGQRGQWAGNELRQVAVVSQRAAGQTHESLVVDVVERIVGSTWQRGLGAPQCVPVGTQIG
jgi:hypothetical protein